MTRRQKEKQKKGTTPPIFVFTPAGIKVTQKAMKVFEQSLQQSTSLSEKMAFAHETMQRVKGKLDMMSTSIGLLCLTTFDYNEKIVIATAIQQYILEALFVPLATDQQRELKICKQVERFALDNLQITSQTQD